MPAQGGAVDFAAGWPEIQSYSGRPRQSESFLDLVVAGSFKSKRGARKLGSSA